MNPYDAAKPTRNIQLGFVTLLALSALVGGLIYAGGDKGFLFEETSSVTARMVNVGGLKVGAPVTMSGLSIGRVHDIRFSVPKEGPRIDVIMEINQGVRNRIKKDSVPTIRTQGMMGDRYMDISMGTLESRMLPEDEPLIGSPMTEMDQAIKQATSVLKQIEQLLATLQKKEGTMGKLFYDQKLYESLTVALREFSELMRSFKENPGEYVDLSIF